MNQKQYVVAGLTFGIILGALICAGIVVAVAHRPAPQPTPAIAATSTASMTLASSVPIVVVPPPKMEAQSLFWESSTSSIKQFSCFFGQGDTCVLSIQDFKADIQALKAIRSGNFVISGNNISVPIGNGSSTDLMSVLNYIQSELQK